MPLASNWTVVVFSFRDSLGFSLDCKTDLTFVCKMKKLNWIGSNPTQHSHKIKLWMKRLHGTPKSPQLFKKFIVSHLEPSSTNNEGWIQPNFKTLKCLWLQWKALFAYILSGNSFFAKTERIALFSSDCLNSFMYFILAAFTLSQERGVGQSPCANIESRAERLS